MMELLSSAQVEQFLEAKLADREIAGLIQQFALPYRELMAYYRCAMMEVSEKFHVLNEEMSLQYDRNSMTIFLILKVSPLGPSQYRYFGLYVIVVIMSSEVTWITFASVRAVGPVVTLLE